MKQRTLVLVTISLINCWCSGQAQPSSGSVSEKTYTSQYFKFRISIPDGWIVLPAESQTRIRLSGEPPTTLLWLSSKAPSASGTFPRSSIGLVILAEDTSRVVGVHDGKDVLAKITAILTGTDPPHQITSTPKAVTHSGQEFYRLDYKQEYQQVTHYFCTEATVQKGFAIRLSVIADSKADADLACNIANSIIYF